MTTYWLYRWLRESADFSDLPIKFQAESDANALEQAKNYPPCFRFELYEGSGWNSNSRQIIPSKTP